MRHFHSMKVHHATGIILFAFVLHIDFICVYMYLGPCVCVCVSAHLHTCVHMCMHVANRSLFKVSFSIALNLIFWKESLTELGTWNTLI